MRREQYPLQQQDVTDKNDDAYETLTTLQTAFLEK
jgi:hypothetical protein